MTDVIFLHEPNLTTAEFTDVLLRSGLAERRPVASPDRIERMLRNADLLITARLRGQLIGVARALTDYSYACYLSDLAVDKTHQLVHEKLQTHQTESMEDFNPLRSCEPCSRCLHGNPPPLHTLIPSTQTSPKKPRGAVYGRESSFPRIQAGGGRQVQTSAFQLRHDFGPAGPAP